jgi:hypothetical protein
MTEVEWLGCDEPSKMLWFLRERVTSRKARLLMAACCRRGWSLFVDDRCRNAVEIAERFAEGLAKDEERNSAWQHARDAYADINTQSYGEVGNPWHPIFAAEAAAEAAIVAVSRIDDAVDAASLFLPERSLDDQQPSFLMALDGIRWMLVALSKTANTEDAAQVQLIHDIFGNPFSPVAVDPTWRTPTVTSLAIAAYEERNLPSGELDAVRLALLADALEEAGCSAETILDHLREPGPHIRGCWAVDLLLARE